MKIIHRYLIKEFLKPFFAGLFCFIIIFALAEFFGKMDTFSQYSASFKDISTYLLLLIPTWIVQSIPVAVLLGCLASLEELYRRGEIVGMQTSGISPYLIIKPLLICGLFLSIVSFTIQEFVANDTNKNAKLIYETKIKGQNIPPPSKYYNLVGSYNSSVYRINCFDYKQNKITNITIHKFSPDFVLQEEIYAPSGLWDGENWVLENAIINKFISSEQLITKELKKYIWEVNIKPEDFLLLNKESSEMNFNQLKKHIQRLESLGYPTIKERVELHFRISFPLSCLVVVLLGIPIAFRLAHLGRALGFTISIFIAFIYWGMFQLGQVLGINGILPPVLSVWLANIIFTALGIVLFFI